MSKSLLLLLFLPILLLLPVHSAKDYGYDMYKSTCGVFGKMSVQWCQFSQGIKSSWFSTSVTFSPGKTRNMTYEELKSRCDDIFVCLENTGCYKDFVNYQNLDKCIDDVFQLGPMSYCDETLREVKKKNPEQLTDCVKEKLEQTNPEKIDCVSIQQTGECYLPDVQKHCDPHFAAVFKQHLEMRLYNRACGGRLRYKDWDYVGGQDVAIQMNPGGVKVADPKRDQVNGTINTD